DLHARERVERGVAAPEHQRPVLLLQAAHEVLEDAQRELARALARQLGPILQRREQVLEVDEDGGVHRPAVRPAPAPPTTAWAQPRAHSPAMPRAARRRARARPAATAGARRPPPARR